jgi:hypothetical protein
MQFTYFIVLACAFLEGACLAASHGVGLPGFIEGRNNQISKPVKDRKRDIHELAERGNQIRETLKPVNAKQY